MAPKKDPEPGSRSREEVGMNGGREIEPQSDHRFAAVPEEHEDNSNPIFFIF